MISRKLVLDVVVAFGLVFATASAQNLGAERIHVTVDTSEADQVLAILALRHAGKPIDDAHWQNLFATTPYQRMKERYSKIAEQFHDPSAAFTDDNFKKFVMSGDLPERAPALHETLERWKQADLRRSAEGVLGYLPEQAAIRATVYPIINEGRGGFVWDLRKDPAIFLFVDPKVTSDKFANNVAHELHHIGLGSVGPIYDQKIAGLPENAKRAAEWMEGFAEGIAMLAAAGGPNIDPHAASDAVEHAEWEKELAAFNTDLPAVNQFFSDVLADKLGKDAMEKTGSSFFGAHQGPWYTVGYKMAVLVEKRFGRPALIRSMLDYRCLLRLYNAAVLGQQLPQWSEKMLDDVRAGTCQVKLK